MECPKLPWIKALETGKTCTVNDKSRPKAAFSHPANRRSRSAVCLVAVGYNMGTLSEMALGLKWERPVFVLHGQVQLPGAVEVTDRYEMLEKVVSHLLA